VLVLKSLCSASYIRWQRGTARIRPPHAAALSAGCAAIDWAYSSKPAAAACGDAEWGGLTDGRPAVT